MLASAVLAGIALIACNKQSAKLEKAENGAVTERSYLPEHLMGDYTPYTVSIAIPTEVMGFKSNQEWGYNNVNEVKYQLANYDFTQWKDNTESAFLKNHPAFSISCKK